MPKTALVLSGGGDKGAFQFMAEKYAREEKGYNWDIIAEDLRIGVVSLRTGEYMIFRSKDPGFKKAVLASTSIPIVWSPVEISPEHKDMVDGGLRNISPLGDILDTDPDEVVIINCSSPYPPKRKKPFKNVLDIGKHSLEIALNEIFITDVREFIRINKNVQEAAEKGVTLHNENGKPYKHYKYKIIQPDNPLDDSLDFSREATERSIRAGWEKAKKVLG